MPSPEPGTQKSVTLAFDSRLGGDLASTENFSLQHGCSMRRSPCRPQICPQTCSRGLIRFSAIWVRTVPPSR